MKHEYEFEDLMRARVRCECHAFIITAAVSAVTYIAGAVSAGAAAVGAASAAAATGLGAATATGLATIGVTATDLAAVGITAGAIGTTEMGILTGAALGAGEAAVMGGDPGMGALGGAISGGTLAAAGPVLGSTLGSAFAGDVAAGAAGGTLSSAATGGDLRAGALGGAASGALNYGMGQLATPAAGAAGAGTAGGAGAGGAVTPGVESVTVTGNPPPPGINLAGVVNKAPTTADKTAGTPGVESVTVPGVRPGTAPVSPLTPTLAGALAPKPVTGNLSATGQQTDKTTGTPGAGVGVGAPASTLPTEKVTVSAEAPTTTHTGTIAPTAAGLSTGPTTEGVGTGDDIEKKDTQQAPDIGTDDQTYLEKLTGKTEDLLSNPLTLLAGGALLADATGLFHGGNASGELAGGAGKQAAALDNTAAQSAVEAERLRALGDQNILQGQDLQNYLQTGTLPPGMQAQINAARESAKAGARQMYSNMGMGQGNTSLYADLANIDMTAASSSAALGEKLYDSGVAQQTLGQNLYTTALSYTNAGTEIYQNLLKTNIEADSNLSKSVNDFVSALAKMGGPAQSA